MHARRGPLPASISALAAGLGLALALTSACSNTTPDAPSAKPPESTPPPASEEGVSFASPPVAESPEEEPPAADPALDARIKELHGDSCRYERSCGDLVGIDCNAAVDGPYYYARRDTLEIVARCGGACMGGQCTNCPPAEWTCATY
ncbi:MAG: hypothetical protein H6711_20550 [Myxococcales bacterium]|nr:hypothetical protein [Myxococcales bacterium]